MDQLKLFLRILSRRDLDELLGDAHNEQSERSKGGTHNSAEGDNSNFQATIEGMQR